MKIKIIHLADLHCNKKDEVYLKMIGEGLRNDLLEISKSIGAPDFICITGDLINRGDLASEEFEMAESIFLNPLEQSLNLTRDAFFFVPGNHEIDRSQISKAFEIGLDQSLVDQQSLKEFLGQIHKGSPDEGILKRKLKAYTEFVEKQKNKQKKFSSFFYEAYEIPINGIKVGIVALNSSWRCSQFGTDDKRLIIGDYTVIEAASKVSDCDLKICLCHHPIEMLAPWDTKPVRQAIAKNFNVLLNGHVHDSDASWAKQILGNLFISTAGCLKPTEQFTSYSIIELDLASDTIKCSFRKWYKERQVFDQDTSKASGGYIDFFGIKTGTPKMASALSVAVVRQRLQAYRTEADIVKPINGIEEVELDEVFVEPLLTNKSGYDRDPQEKKTLSLEELLKSNENILLAGRPEFGKTTIIKYAKDYILKHDKFYDFKIPVLVKFREIPKSGIRLFIRQIAKLLGQTEAEIIGFATNGQLTLLIDDFNDRQDLDHEKRVATVREFHKAYPKCRFIFTITEYIAAHLQLELMALASDFQAEVAYIGSLNTAKIRQLLQKWKVKQDFNLEAMLNQILYYFQHCQIPVTPLAVVLFLGVLFNRKKEKNIKNEAFLIENYLETILEKVNPGQSDSEPDFRDKEDFLAAYALEIVQLRKTCMSEIDFEQFKINYYNKRDEDLPRYSVFESFFEKGILTRDDGRVFFRRRFWFHFFLAKALESNKDSTHELLLRPDVLKFSKALSYKAGLSRKDVDLLKWVDEKAMKDLQPIIDKYGLNELKDVGQTAVLKALTDSISKELREKNTDEKVDARRDEIHLKYEEDTGGLEDDQSGQLDDLITLQSGIIRNTTQITVTDKRKFIDNNLCCYIALMWSGIEMFRDTIENADEQELFKLFFRGRKDTSMKHKIQIVMEHAQRFVHFVVPLSVLVYMDEHLGNPKLSKSFRMLADQSKSPTKKLFYLILNFSQSPRDGIKSLNQLITPESSITEDYIILGYLRWYCYQNKVEEPILQKILKVYDDVRRKYAKRTKNETYFLKDTYIADLKKDLQSKHI